MPSSIVNLHYADNILLFGICKISQAAWLRGILSYSELWSELRINYHKNSMIVLGKRTLTTKIIKALFGCKEVRLPISYLGVPIGKDKIAKRSWLPLIDIIEQKLDRWKVRYVSLGSSLILLNVVLSAMPVYLMSVTILPSWVLEKIHRIRIRFLLLGCHKTEPNIILYPGGNI